MGKNDDKPYSSRAVALKGLKVPLHPGSLPEHYQRILFSRCFWGPPQPKERPRFAWRGRRKFAYTPPSTLEWEINAANGVRLTWQNEPIPRYVPLACSVTIVWPRPKNRPKAIPLPIWKRGCRWYHSVRPDADNVIKAVWDVLKRGKVFEDDSQIVSGNFNDYYAAKGEKAHVKVVLCEIVIRDKQC